MSDTKLPPEHGANTKESSAEGAYGPPAEEAVGYRRPPKSGQFKKGQSGNPRGQPKPGRPSGNNVLDILEDEARRTVTVRDGGKAGPVTMLRLALLSLMRQAAQGDIGAVRMLFAELRRLGLMKSSSQRPSGGVRRIPQAIATRVEFDARFELMPDGRHWRQRSYREARMYLVRKLNAVLAAPDVVPDQDSPSISMLASGDEETPFSPSIEEAFGPPAVDAVGYGRPPKANWFKKGRSGNPKGRPKRRIPSGLGSVAEVIRALINLEIRVREGDKVVRMTLLRAVIRAFLAKAARGDLRAIKTLLAELAQLDPHPEERAGWLVVPRGSLTWEESDAWCVRLPDYSARQATLEEAQAYLKKIGREPAPVHVVISGDEKEPLIIEVPAHLRPSGSN